MDEKIVERYVAEQKVFQERSRKMGHAEAADFFWYHTVDLGDGLVTPGLYDFRETVECFGFPSGMKGMTVLDVGSATGFFSFEFERRGARVISVDLPSLEELDRFPGQTTEQLIGKLERMILPALPRAKLQPERPITTAEMYFRLLDGPYRFCHARLKSKAERCFSTVYDLSAEKLGVAAFDLIFLGDILLHTFYPWKALAAVAPLCKPGGLLVLSQVMPEDLGAQPAMLYVGGDDPQGDDISWWWPNQACFEKLLKKMGFKTVVEAGRNRGVLRTTAYPFDRPVLHARK
jgi:tRNA (mo5U34)-methyltransferase